MRYIETSANLGILSEDCPVVIWYEEGHYEVYAYHDKDHQVNISRLVPFEWVDSEIRAKVEHDV